MERVGERRRAARSPSGGPPPLRSRCTAAPAPNVQKKMSVVEITKPGTYIGGVPIRQGLNDPALGTADPRSTCTTCGNTYSGTGKVNDCPGHFGHIEVGGAPAAAAAAGGSSCVPR